jgi:chemotaxis methyl-accepting protein methylase
MHFDEFLREAAPLFGLQWRPFQRRGVKRKIEHRILQAGLFNFEEYLFKVRSDPAELDQLSKILTITISRFFRDRAVFDNLEHSILPSLLKEEERTDLKVWSIGCASGEEPYTLAISWKEKFQKIRPQIRLSILATDINEELLKRAKDGRYKKSSLKEVPQDILESYFKMDNEFYILDKGVRESVEFRRHDIIREIPFLGMDLVFCRNLAFTYFSKDCQIEVLKKIAISLKGEGYLVIGKDEALPLIYPTLFVPTFPAEKIYQKFYPLTPSLWP